MNPITQVIDAVSAAIKAEYPEYSILGSYQIRQGIEDNCFCIERLRTDHKPQLSRATRRSIQLEILWFPSEDNIMANEVESVELTLYTALRTVTAQDRTFHAAEMSAETVDDVLHFFVTYNTLDREQEQKPVSKTFNGKVGFKLK